MYLNIIWT